MGWWSVYKAQLTGTGRCFLNCGSLLTIVALLKLLIGAVLIGVSEKAIDEGEESKKTVLWIGIAILVAAILLLTIAIFICCRICFMIRGREKRANQPARFIEKVPPPPAGSYPGQEYQQMKSTSGGPAGGQAPSQQSAPSAPPPQP